MAELVDAHGSGPCAFGCGGSSPLLGTKIPQKADRRKMVGFLYCGLGNRGRIDIQAQFNLVLFMPPTEPACPTGKGLCGWVRVQA